jgi:hypothetical protein
VRGACVGRNVDVAVASVIAMPRFDANSTAVLAVAVRGAKRKLDQAHHRTIGPHHQLWSATRATRSAIVVIPPLRATALDSAVGLVDHDAKHIIDAGQEAICMGVGCSCM